MRDSIETIEKEYQEIKVSGMFWVYFPELSGVWEADQEEFIDFYRRREDWIANQLEI